MAKKRSNPFPHSNASGVKKGKEANEYAPATEPPLPNAAALETLLNAQQRHHEEVPCGEGNVVHWFRSDLRLEDNRALHKASETAYKSGKSLIALYIISPQDWRYHRLAAIRVDFILRTLKILKRDLAHLHIALHIETVEPRKGIPSKIVELMKGWKATDLFANIEYEIDELDRDENLINEAQRARLRVIYYHDQCVVEPGAILNAAGKPMSVFSPFLRKWIFRIHDDNSYLSASPKPAKNPASAKEDFARIFQEDVPSAPSSHSLSESDQKRFAALWPAGEHEALARLEKFSVEKIHDYATHRSEPASDATSCLSVHLSQGTLSARTCILLARASNTSNRLDKGKPGIVSWVSEVAWRDFYRHILAAWPHICKNRSYKSAYDKIAWEDNEEGFKAWCEGRTGVPIVDAAMRQMNTTGWMHNRCRMITASFLSKHLLIYWRLGERYFMEHLIDGDFASNNGGWQWIVGSGNDASPWFRIFNPWAQSAKFDPDGQYIKRYVKELQDLPASAIHEPHEKLDKPQIEKTGYPKPMVDHKFARERCLERYRAAVTSNEE